MTVSAEYAAEHLSELLDAADRGEEVEIARPEKPILKLVSAPIREISMQPGQRVLGVGCGDRVLGSLRGELRVPTDEEWKAMDKDLERLMNDAPLMSSGEI